MPEKRIVLKNCELIDPREITTHVDRDGFKASAKAFAMAPEEVIEEIKASGLKGRGGAGFPSGAKWEMARRAPGDEKFFICNADEGEVGTFKDRYILEHDPFTLIEGMAIACHAIGATRAFLYLRWEYHYLRDALSHAVDAAREKGLLQGIEDIRIHEGAGSYVCGEESALMNSIEGRRGEARYRPPFPATRGLFGKPTVIDNVETLMNVPPIILNGAQWFASIGTEKSKGTKVFSVCGDAQRPGVYELPMGSSLRELVMDLAGATNVKMVQVGGASGAVVPAAGLDTPLSFETVLGSGAVTVLDDSRDVIEFAYRCVQFSAAESCGKCTPCREGSEVMLEILGRLSRGEGAQGDIKALEELSDVMLLSSICGLGQAAPTPVLDTLRYFRGDYENRITQSVLLREHRCRNCGRHVPGASLRYPCQPEEE
jgi:NADP-reducing hydrogenase subunit HndC